MKLTNEEYLKIARIARQHADCKGSHVGAVLVLPNGTLVLGTNGSPVGRPRCVDGGCYRCARRDKFKPGEGYDKCTCVHAEGACLMVAAQHGIAVAGGTIYSTLRPCRECSKQMLNAGIQTVYFEEDRLPADPEELDAYLELQEAFSGGVRQVATNASLPTAA